MRCAQVLGAAAALLTAITTASPTVKTHELSIRKGGYETGGAQIVELAFLIKDLIEDKHNAYASDRTIPIYSQPNNNVSRL